MGIPSLTEHLAGCGHWQDSGLLWTHRSFIFGTLWGSVQADRGLVSSGLTGISALWNLWGPVHADRSLISSGPAGVSALGHCGIQFRLTAWFPQDLLGIQFWYIVGFISGWWESGLLRTHWGFSIGTLWGSVEADMGLVSSGPTRLSVLRHCGVQFRLTGAWSPQDPLGLQHWDIVGFSWGWHESGLLRTH